MRWQDAPVLEAEKTAMKWDEAPLVGSEADAAPIISRKLRVHDAIQNTPANAISGEIGLDPLDIPEYLPSPTHDRTDPISVIGGFFSKDGWASKDRPQRFKGETITLNPAERLEAARAYSKKVGRDATLEIVKRAIPFGTDVFNAMNAMHVRKAQDRILAGEGSSEDYLVAAQFEEAEARDAKTNQTIPGRAGLIAAQMPKYIGEFVATGPIYGFGKKLMTSAAMRAFGAGVGKNLGTRLATGLAGRAVGVGLQASINPQMVASSATRRMVHDLGVSPDEAGVAQNIIAREGESAAVALPKGFVDSFIELGSERAGSVFGKAGRALPKGVKESAHKALTASIMTRWMARNPGQGVNGFQKALKSAGWNGIVGEMFEERVADVARGATTDLGDFGTVGDIATGKWGEAGKQLASEGLAFMIPTVGSSAIGHVSKGFKGETEARDVSGVQDAARTWAEANPGDAAKLVEAYERDTSDSPKGQVSRGAWYASNLPTTLFGERADNETRATFAKAAKERLAEPPSQAPVETPTEAQEAAPEQVSPEVVPEAPVAPETQPGDLQAPETTDSREIDPGIEYTDQPAAPDLTMLPADVTGRDSLATENYDLNLAPEAEQLPPPSQPSVEPEARAPWEMSKEEWESQPEFIPREMEDVDIAQEIAELTEKIKSASSMDAFFYRDKIKDLKRAKDSGKQTYKRPIGEPPPGYRTSTITENGKTSHVFSRGPWKKDAPKAKEQRVEPEATQVEEINPALLEYVREQVRRGGGTASIKRSLPSNLEPYSNQVGPAVREITGRGKAEPNAAQKAAIKRVKGAKVETPEEAAAIESGFAESDARLRAIGATLDNESESGSRYYTLPDGKKVRVADHDANDATDQWIERNDVKQIRVDKRGWKASLDATAPSTPLTPEEYLKAVRPKAKIVPRKTAWLKKNAKEASKRLDSMGIKHTFIAGKSSFTHQDTGHVFLGKDGLDDENTLRIIGDEVTHALGLDKDSQAFNEDEIQFAAKEYVGIFKTYYDADEVLKGKNPSEVTAKELEELQKRSEDAAYYVKLMTTESGRVREEAIAHLAGKAWMQPRFLAELESTNQPLWKKIVDAIVRFLSGDNLGRPLLASEQKLLEELRGKLASADILESAAEVDTEAVREQAQEMGFDVESGEMVEEPAATQAEEPAEETGPVKLEGFERTTKAPGTEDRKAFDELAQSILNRRDELQKKYSKAQAAVNKIPHAHNKKRAAAQQEANTLGRAWKEADNQWRDIQREYNLSAIEDSGGITFNSPVHREQYLVELLEARGQDASAHRHNVRVAIEEEARKQSDLSPDEQRFVAEDTERGFSYRGSSLPESMKYGVRRIKDAREGVLNHTSRSVDGFSYLTDEQKQGFKEQVAALKDAGADWHQRQQAILEAANEQNEKEKEPALERRRLENEQAAKDAVEKARRDAIERRETRRKHASEPAYWRSVKDRAKDMGDKGTVATSEYTDDQGNTRKKKTKTIVVGSNWEIREYYTADASRKDGLDHGWNITHVPTGKGLGAYNKESDARELFVLFSDLGIKWDAATEQAVMEVVPDLKKAIRAFDDHRLWELDKEQQDALFSTVKAKPTTVNADIILDAADLGIGMEKAIGSWNANQAGTATIFKLAKELAEFRYNPVFTADGKGGLVFRDGYKYTIPANNFDLEGLEAGTTVGINLEDVGIDRATEQDVVAEALTNQTFLNVKKAKDGTVTGTYRAGKVTVTKQGESWVATGAPLATERATQSLERIRWTQPGQASDGPSKGAMGPPVGRMAPDATEPTPTPHKKGGKKNPKTQAFQNPPPLSTKQGETVESVSAHDIIATLSRDFGVPIKIGRIAQAAEGIYKFLEEVVRLKGRNVGNLMVATHEVAHHLDKKYNLTHGMPASLRREVAALDYQPNRKDRDVATREGFAEFVRHYLTDEEASTLAPGTSAWFDKFLDRTPDVAKAMDRAKRKITQFRSMTPEQRVEIQMQDEGTTPTELEPSFNQRFVEPIMNAARARYAEWVDRLYPLKMVSDAARKKGKRLPKGSTAYELAMFSDMAAMSHAQRALSDGVHTVSENNRVIGPGLRDALLEISSTEYDDWKRYHYARHALDSYDKRPGFNPGITLEDAQDVYNNVSGDPSKAARYEKASRAVTEFNNNLLRMLVDAGVKTPEEADKMLEWWGETYMSLRRVKPTGIIQKLLGRGLLNTTDPVKRRSKSGSGLPVMDPIHSTVLRAAEFYDSALKHQVKLALIRETVPEFGGAEGMGNLVEVVPANKVPSATQLSELLDQLVSKDILEEEFAREIKVVGSLRRGVPNSKSLLWLAKRFGQQVNSAADVDIQGLRASTSSVPDIETVLTIWRPNYSPSAKEYVERTVIDGKPYLVQYHPDLYKSLSSLSPLELGPFVKMVAAFNRVFKLGAVGLSTGFGVANLVRDPQQFQYQTKYSRGVESTYNWANELGVFIRNDLSKLGVWGGKSDDAAKLHEETGGKLSTRLGTDSSSLTAIRKDIVAHSTASHLRELVAHPLQSMRDLITISDVGPRLAEFVAVLRSHGYVRNAQGHLINQSTQQRERPPRHVIVEAANAAADVNINYKRAGYYGRWVEQFLPFFNASVQAQDKQARTFKDAFVGDGNLSRLVITAAAVAAATAVYWWFRHDDDDYKAQADWLKYGFWTFTDSEGTPFFRVSKGFDWNIVPNLTEAFLSSISEQQLQPLAAMMERQAIQRVPGGQTPAGPALEAAMNYDTFRQAPIETPDMQRLPARERFGPHTSELAKLIGYYTGDVTGISPAKLEHMADNYTGGAYGRVSESVGNAAKGDLLATDIPGARAVLLKRDYVEDTGDFYNERESLNEELAAAKLRKEELPKELEERATLFNDHAELMAEIRKPIRTESDREKRFANEKYIIGLAREALGREPLERYPSPYADSNLPPQIQDAVEHVVHGKVLMVARTYPLAITKAEKAAGVTIKSKQDKWRADVQRAVEWLKARNISTQAAVKAHKGSPDAKERIRRRLAGTFPS